MASNNQTPFGFNKITRSRVRGLLFLFFFSVFAFFGFFLYLYNYENDTRTSFTSNLSFNWNKLSFNTVQQSDSTTMSSSPSLLSSTSMESLQAFLSRTKQVALQHLKGKNQLENGLVIVMGNEAGGE